MSAKTDRILKAGEKLFAARRYHEVTLDEVAAEAQVGKGTIYLHFKDKEDLYFQVLFGRMDELVASLERLGPDERPDGQLRHVLKKLLDFYGHRQSLFSLMHSEQLRRSGRTRALREKIRRGNERLAGVVEATIRRGMQQGRYRKSIPPRAAARLLLGMARSALWHHDDMPRGADLAALIVNVFESGLRSGAPP